MYIQYRSISDLNSQIVKNMHKFPHDVDLVVGIPRSGMLPANLLALYLNKPFTDIDSFVNDKIYSSGERGRITEKDKVTKVLVVDDSIAGGSAISQARAKLQVNESRYEIVYAAIFASTLGKKMVDIWCEVIDGYRIFQWNFFHHPVIMPMTCMDIDGVLCKNPPIDDDGEKYIEYITNATPYFIPTVEIDTLVSCRLEKYRFQTETWLKKYGIKYRNLVLLDLPSKEERIKWGKHGVFKGEIYKKSDNILFVESSLSEAMEICRISGKQVFCTETFEMYDDYSTFFRESLKLKSRVKASFKSLLFLFHLKR